MNSDKWMYYSLLAVCITVSVIIGLVSLVEYERLQASEECKCVIWLNDDQDIKCIIRKDYLPGRTENE